MYALLIKYTFALPHSFFCKLSASFRVAKAFEQQGAQGGTPSNDNLAI